MVFGVWLCAYGWGVDIWFSAYGLGNMALRIEFGRMILGALPDKQGQAKLTSMEAYQIEKSRIRNMIIYSDACTTSSTI